MPQETEDALEEAKQRAGLNFAQLRVANKDQAQMVPTRDLVQGLFEQGFIATNTTRFELPQWFLGVKVLPNSECS